MPLTPRSQFFAFILIAFGAAYIAVFDPPLIILTIYVILCISWSAWCFISVFRGPDEVESASVRFALAFASSIGVPLLTTFVILMIASPAIQSPITLFAATARHGLGPAPAGFAMGIAFSIMMLSVTLCVGLVVWRVSKR